MDAKLEAAQEELNRRVLGREGVSGTAIGEHRGKPCLKVLVSDPRVGEELPRSVAGFRVVMEETGGFWRL